MSNPYESPTSEVNERKRTPLAGILFGLFLFLGLIVAGGFLFYQLSTAAPVGVNNPNAAPANQPAAEKDVP